MVAFAVVFCLMIVGLCDLFELSNGYNFAKRFSTFRDLPKDTVDAVWIGTSGADRYWLAPKAYDKYGMTVYTLSSEAMPTWLFTNMIDEAYTYQNPELILIDLRAFGQNNTKKNVMDVRARRVLDGMKAFSPNRIKTGFKAMQTIYEAHKENQSRFDLSYLLSFIKYHTQWAEDDFSFKKGFGENKHEYAGFYVNKTLSVQVKPQNGVIYSPDVYEDLDPVAEESLYDLLAYIKEKNLNVLFVDTPQFKDKTEMGRANTVYKILNENGVDYVHFFTEREDGAFTIEFDWQKDFYDSGHVNYYGAEKFTDVFVEYLRENYDLPDRRDDPKVQAHWEGKYEAVLKAIKKYEK